MPRLLGLVAAARSFPPASLSLFPPCSLFRSFFFFLEGQVLTFHGLLATASTSLSNRRAGDGPHRGDRAGKEASRNPHPRLLVMREGDQGFRGQTLRRGDERARGPGRAWGRGKGVVCNPRQRKGSLRALDPNGKGVRARNRERRVGGGGQARGGNKDRNED